MAVLVVQHTAAEGPGRIGEALNRAGRSLVVRRTHLGEAVPRRARGWDGVVVLGGPMGALDDAAHPNLADERALLADAAATGIPVLGVCLGAQLLAVALGAELRRGGTLELGWLPVLLTSQGRHDPVLGAAPERFTPLHWHGDVITVPPGGDLLATSAATQVQAFRHGARAYGLLFHVEADAEHAAAMAAAFPADVAAAGTDAAVLSADPAAAALAPVADDVLDRWVAMLRPDRTAMGDAPQGP
jgi:GMP synthase-like glutamine amidotransferase